MAFPFAFPATRRTYHLTRPYERQKFQCPTAFVGPVDVVGPPKFLKDQGRARTRAHVQGRKNNSGVHGLCPAGKSRLKQLLPEGSLGVNGDPSMPEAFDPDGDFFCPLLKIGVYFPELYPCDVNPGIPSYHRRSCFFKIHTWASIEYCHICLDEC